VHRIVKDHGETLQYSVFLCDLAPQELTGLKWRLGQAMAHDVDSILVLDLGDPVSVHFPRGAVGPADLWAYGPVVRALRWLVQPWGALAPSLKRVFVT